MKKLQLLVLCSISVLVLEVAALPPYHQTDYDVEIERVEIVWYNHSYARDVKFDYIFYNRTQKAFNASAHFLRDGTTDFVVEVQLYQFLSNEYRYFPLTLGTNICEEYANNNFNMREILRKISNFHNCPLKKGLYYAYNVVVDFSLFPPYIPRGRYKAATKFYYNKEFVAEGNAYGAVVNKPIKWQ